MAAEKLSVSLEAEVLERVRRAAERDGMPLSRWLNNAASRAVDLAEAHAALEEHFAEYGEPSSEARAEARAALEATGVGRPVPLEDAEAAEEALAYLDRISEVDEE
ncbi:hypothetical protein [Nocardiopsis kunsanensis]|nr:hypothetical protein [Nocardiopsis kunsanensis]